jgi:hypothetical protein
MGTDGNTRDVYVTVSGDRWDGIAKAVLGDERLAKRMMEMNPDHADVFVFEEGVVLMLPKKEPEAPARLPPWKTANR